jgi:hypothetical protein
MNARLHEVAGGLVEGGRELTPGGVNERMGKYVPKWQQGILTSLDEVSNDLFDDAEYIRNKTRKKQGFIELFCFLIKDLVCL